MGWNLINIYFCVLHFWCRASLFTIILEHIRRNDILTDQLSYLHFEHNLSYFPYHKTVRVSESHLILKAPCYFLFEEKYTHLRLSHVFFVRGYMNDITSVFDHFLENEAYISLGGAVFFIETLIGVSVRCFFCFAHLLNMNDFSSLSLSLSLFQTN